MSKEEVIPRAERRRMMRDPLRVHKMFAVNMKAPEYDRLIAHGQIIISEMNDIQQCMAGLGSTPKRWRLIRQEEFNKKWNECVEKLEGIQERIKEIEESNTANEKTDSIPTSADNRGRSVEGTEPGEHNQ